MRSVADDLRRESLEAAAGLEAWARVELAFRLGEDDLAMFARANGISRERAKETFARARAIGRVASRSNDPDPA